METIEEKKNMLLAHKVAVWDVLESCEIRGADDGSIKNPRANDMSLVLDAAPVQAVFATGQKAAGKDDFTKIPAGCREWSRGRP